MKQWSNLQNLLKNALANNPEKIAIRAAWSQVSYLELDEQARRIAMGLRENGVECGDRVAWFLPNCLEAVLATLACYGAVAVPLNYRYVTFF